MAPIEAMWMIEKYIYVQPHAGVSTARENGSSCSEAGTFTSFALSNNELFLVSFLKVVISRKRIFKNQPPPELLTPKLEQLLMI